MNKYDYVWIVQGNYGYGHGWEDLTCGTYREACIDLKAYRENEPYPFRKIQRRLLKQNDSLAKAV